MFPDLTAEEQQLLLDIRRRKAELLQEIQRVSSDEVVSIAVWRRDGEGLVCLVTARLGLPTLSWVYIQPVICLKPCPLPQRFVRWLTEQLKDEISEVAMDMESVESGEDGKNDQKKKQLSIGRKKFNMDPKKGIEFLCEHELLKNTAEGKNDVSCVD
ncbi:Cytohesin-1 [Amphibalanus amphitrite]|uniref:Cytohesin-1 n=1 Tax=Amphibalanus amphitrite TaxID=1232801 RepID=A0A6A4WND0_AMPAM|nr:Cytohesin-1 [Amphibalanus amphitrite]